MDNVGLFGTTGSTSVVRNVGLRAADVTGRYEVGGLVGYSNGTIRISYVTGGVTGQSGGGLAGFNQGRIVASYASAAVTTADDAGGLVGFSGSGTRITASYATGPVTGRSRAGGLTAGSVSGITASYATGAVTGDGTVGGLVGANFGSTTASYWDTTTSGVTTGSGGTGKTTSELQTPTGYTGIYADWNVDIDGVAGSDDPWDFGTASEYPVLKVDFDGNGTASWEEFGGQRPNRAPAFDEDPPIERTVAENTAADQNIGLPVTATDPDAGDEVTYALSGTDADDFDLVAATGQLRTKAALDYETKAEYVVTITASDDAGASASVEVTIAVGDLPETPPAPRNLAAGTATASSVPLSWDAVTGAAKYRVEYRATDTDTETVTWTIDDETLTTATHIVDELDCGTDYEFQVSAYGDGTTHSAEWSLPTDPLPAATTGCPPVFPDEPYTFGVAEDAVVETVVGTVAATVAGDEAITHAITAGDDGDAFAIGETSGELTVQGALDMAALAEYELTVQASVGSGEDVRTATTTVTLTVQGAPPAPQNLAAETATATSVPLTWDTVAGAAKYRVEYRETDTETETDPVTWTTHNDTLTGSPHTVDSLDCGTAYAFQVTAFGDQVVHTAAWGMPATAVPATTAACASTFGEGPFEFTVSEGADIDAAVGTVLATDAGGAEVTHAITAGNEAGRFAIHETTGALTVAAALDYLDTASYTLTVTASAGGTTEATVTITVTGVDCANGTVIADPRDHAALVGDCRVLLAAQPTLEGTGTLNWSEELALASWEGVSSSGTPSRVTGLDVSDESLGGTIPSTLGTLTALTTLDLSDNELTGAVPTELSALTSLTTLALSGNTLSGCVPAALRTLATAITAAGGTHDIAALSLPFCDAHAPVPTGVSAAVASTTSVAVSWDGATDVDTLTYRVEYRQAGSTGAWTVDAEDVTATRHMVDDLTCGTRYAFRVSAKGDGMVSLTAWSSPSDSATAVPLTVVDATMTKVGTSKVRVTWAYGSGCTGIAVARHFIGHVQEFADGTQASAEFQSDQAPPHLIPADLTHVFTGSPLVRASWTRLQILLEGDEGPSARLTFDFDPAPTLVYNQPPAFAQDEYEFSIAEDAAVDAAVGSVSAPDPNADDEVTYTITAGNTGDAFAIDADSGAITVDAALDHAIAPSYTLTVQAADGNGGRTTTTVTVTVTDVVDTAPPAPTNLTATVNEDGEVVLSWDAPADDSITGYQILRRRPTEGEDSLLVYVENTGNTNTTYTDTSVTAGVRHVYRVKAINAIGLSDQSNFARADP